LITISLMGQLLGAEHKPAPPLVYNLDYEGILVDENYDVETPVQDVFVQGSCQNIFNVQTIGDPRGIGYFKNAQNILGMSDGIILATGHAQNAEGPNSERDKSGSLASPDGDVDLNIIASESILDPVGLSFDFIPLDSFVTFRYVFASDEYCEFAGSIYNDVFGFFISGPGIEGSFNNGAKNVALLPDSDDLVSINSVNHLSNSQYYINNALPDDADNCDIPVNSGLHEMIEYDGLTVKMTAQLQLIPCETYHIRLVVADVADKFFDSAVFLEAESFNIGSPVNLSTHAPNNPSQEVFEGCSDAYLRFERSETESIDLPVTVHIEISDESTALEGIDFEPLPTSINIPAWQEYIDLPVYFINDEVEEGVESLIVSLDIPCSCYYDSTYLMVQDAPPISLELPDQVICENVSTTISPQISGGVPGYFYLWSDGSEGESFSITANEAGQYSLRLSDQCGSIASDTAYYQITQAPEAIISGNKKICEGDTAQLVISLSGQSPWSLSYEIDNTFTQSISSITDSLYFLNVMQGGLYEISSLSDGICAGSGAGSGYVEETILAIEPEIESVQCFEESNGSIGIFPEGGIPPYQYEWFEGWGSQSYISGLPAGQYSVKVTDAQGCRKEVSFQVEEPQVLLMQTPDCDQLINGVIDLKAKGGTSPYLYSVDGENFFNNSLFESLTPGESYELFILDSQECLSQETFLMPAVYTDPFSILAPTSAVFGSTETFKLAFDFPESLIQNIQWQPATHLSCDDCLEPEFYAFESSQFNVEVWDIFGCLQQNNFYIEVNQELQLFIPSAFSPNGDKVNDQFVIFGNATQIPEIVELQIFDRWGAHIFGDRHFPPNRTTGSWDGRYKGQAVNEGVYVYFLKVRLFDGTERQLKGSVMVLK